MTGLGDSLRRGCLVVLALSDRLLTPQSRGPLQHALRFFPKCLLLTHRRRVLRDQRFHRVVLGQTHGGSRLLKLCLGLFHLQAKLLLIERHQRLCRLDEVAQVNVHFRDAASNLRTHHGLFVRVQTPLAANHCRPGTQFQSQHIGFDRRKSGILFVVLGRTPLRRRTATHHDNSNQNDPRQRHARPKRVSRNKGSGFPHRATSSRESQRDCDNSRCG